MDIIKILGIILVFHSVMLAQDNILEKLKEINLTSSTKTDVINLLGKGKDKTDSTIYLFEDKSIEVTFSDGSCEDGWLAPKGTVIEVWVSFFEHKKLSDLKNKVKLKKLRSESSYDVGGEKTFYDDEKGVSYVVNEYQKTWSSMAYYPSSKYSQFRCEN